MAITSLVLDLQICANNCNLNIAFMLICSLVAMTSAGYNGATPPYPLCTLAQKSGTYLFDFVDLDFRHCGRSRVSDVEVKDYGCVVVGAARVCSFVPSRKFHLLLMAPAPTFRMTSR